MGEMPKLTKAHVHGSGSTRTSDTRVPVIEAVLWSILP